MRSKFQTWYASEVAEQLKEDSVANLKVDISATEIKPKCEGWLISTLQNLQQRPKVFVNSFKGARIWDAVISVISHKYVYYLQFSFVNLAFKLSLALAKYILHQCSKSVVLHCGRKYCNIYSNI